MFVIVSDTAPGLKSSGCRTSSLEVLLMDKVLHHLQFLES